MRKEQEKFQDQTMNMVACEESRKNFITKLLICKRAKSTEMISRPDYECGRVRRVQEEFQDHTKNVEVCEECRKNFNTRL